MRSLHIAVAQIHTRTCQVAANLDRLRRQVASAAAVGVQAIVFAESVIHSYDLSAENLALAEPPDGAICQKLGQLARQYQMTIVAGFWERAPEGCYNSVAIAQPAGPLLVQRKLLVGAKEKSVGLLPGPVTRSFYQVNGVRLASIICADTASAEIKAEVVKGQVDLRCVSTAGGDMIEGVKITGLAEAELATPKGRMVAEYYRKFVCKNELFMGTGERQTPAFASANALGHDGGQVTNLGHCMIVDRFGTVRAQIPGTIVTEHQQDQMVHQVLTWPD